MIHFMIHCSGCEARRPGAVMRCKVCKLIYGVKVTSVLTTFAWNVSSVSYVSALWTPKCIEENINQTVRCGRLTCLVVATLFARGIGWLYRNIYKEGDSRWSVAVTFRIRQFPRDENEALFLMGNVVIVKHLPRSCAQDAGTRNPSKQFLRGEVLSRIGIQWRADDLKAWLEKNSREARCLV